MNKFTPVLTPEMKMADLVHQNYRLLFVLNRLNIPLGFGEKTVEQVCLQNNVETKSFLTLCRVHTSPFLIEKHDLSDLLPALIVEYLQNSHHYFLKQRLPDICEKLNVALSGFPSHDLILSFFEEYENEVTEHMEYENNVFFPYIQKLLNGEKVTDYSVEEYKKRHNNIEEKLTDLSNLLLKYLSSFADSYLISNILLDLDLCNEDLNTHSFLEDEVLIPKIKKIENRAL